MKKSLIAVILVVAFCGLLTVTLLPRPASPTSPPTSQGTPQSAPQNPSQSTPQSTPEATPQSPRLGTAQSPPPQKMPEITSPSPSQTSPQPTPPSGQRPTNRTLQEAVGNATNYMAQTQEPYALLLLNVLYRRFGVTEFADSLQRYDRILATNPDDSPLLRIFRRIADYQNTVEPTDLYFVMADVDKITVPALYADRAVLPDDYMSQLNNAANSGGYLLTHALLATIWLQENNYQMPTDFTEPLYTANAALIGSDTVVTDLEIEAAAFLYMTGHGALVDTAFVQRVVAAQNLDGGWSYSSGTPDGSYWHASVLGLILLLHVEFPAPSYPPMLATATGYGGVYLSPTTVTSTVVLLFAFVNVTKKTMQSSLGQLALRH